jgi:ABC-type sugar transport system ATPase subunit
MAPVRFTDVSKRFGDVVAVGGLTLDIADGEFMVLVGPSGSGKTTALRMLAGLESISGGEIAIGDRVVNRVAPRERDIAMVFQDYALYPQMTVFDNLAFGLRRRKVPREQIDARVRTAAELLDIGPYLDRKPGQLSGGQAQRVALARAFLRTGRDLLILDEPSSGLDPEAEHAMHARLREFRRGTTSLLISHRLGAVRDADLIAVVDEGRVAETGTHAELLALDALYARLFRLQAGGYGIEVPT